MTAVARTTLVVMAAGRSRRFGDGNKLMHPLLGLPLAGHIARTGETMPFLARIAVCAPRDGDVQAMFIASGFTIAPNVRAEEGLSSSLRVGVGAAVATDASAILICLADMPFVRPAHLSALLDGLDAAAGIDLVATQGDRGVSPPVALLARRAPQFMNFTGDQGARALLAGAAKVVSEGRETLDFDTKEDFEMR